jgi:hypothetical protein
LPTSPKAMPGLSALTLSRCAWLKNMKAERPALGALGSFFLRAFFLGASPSPPVQPQGGQGAGRRRRRRLLRWLLQERRGRGRAAEAAGLRRHQRAGGAAAHPLLRRLPWPWAPWAWAPPWASWRAAATGRPPRPPPLQRPGLLRQHGEAWRAQLSTAQRTARPSTAGRAQRPLPRPQDQARRLQA